MKAKSINGQSLQNEPNIKPTKLIIIPLPNVIAANSKMLHKISKT